MSPSSISGFLRDSLLKYQYFFSEKRPPEGWSVCYYTLLFDKNKILPVDSNRISKIDHETVVKYPSDYRYLCWLEETHGYTAKFNLNAHGPERDILSSM